MLEDRRLLTTGDGLIAHYTFDGTSGPVIDSTGFHNGTNHGATRGVGGRFGNAFQFDGSASYVDTLAVGNIPSVGTFSFWLNPKPTTETNKQVFGSVSNASGGKDGYIGNWYREGNRFGFLIFQGNWTSSYIRTSDNSVVPNEWTHLAVAVGSSDDIDIYVNGQLDVSGSQASTAVVNDRALMFGKSILSTNLAFEGLIDDVRIYDRALTAAEVEELAGINDDGLIAHYAFDGISGPVIDSTGSYNGTNHGATRGVAGKFGNAFQFDGVNDYVDTLLPANIPVVSTVSVWVKPTDPRDHGQVYGSIDTTNGGKDGFNAFVGPDRKVGLIYQAANIRRAGIYGPEGAVPQDGWTHVAWTVDSSQQVCIYVNGILSVTGEISIAPTSHDRALMFGKGAFSGAGSHPFNGLIDEVRIYDRALSDAEVKQLAGLGNDLPETGTIDQWYATVGEQIPVTWTVQVVEEGEYTLDIDIEGLNSWDLVDGATVTVDGGDPIDIDLLVLQRLLSFPTTFA
jgi:hypothetical protein